MVGFSKIDITMKETFMNTQVLKAQAMTKAELTKEWKPFFGEDFDAFVKELDAMNKQKDKGQQPTPGEHTELMAYSKLMDYQPTDVIANPQAYMEGGNWRLLYMLKTFQLRQVNRVYSELKDVYKKAIVEKDAKAAAAAAAKLGTFVVLFSLAGATKDELRDAVLGRELPMREHFWNNMLQLMMFSRYDWEQVKKDGLGATLVGQMQPPTPFIDLPWKFGASVIKGGPVDLKFLTMVPIAGKPFYSRATEQGRTAATNRTKSAYLDDIREAVRNENRQDLKNARAKIKKYNVGKAKEQRITTSAISRVMSDEKKKLTEARK